MRKPLKIAVAQPLCVACDPAANAIAHAALVKAAGARIVVFPELSLTGYELAAPPVALDDARLLPLRLPCAVSGSLALAGAPIAGNDGDTFIGMLAIDREGVRLAYSKRFLGGAETGRFTPGKKPIVLEIDGWHIGLGICKDTGIPQHDEELAALGMDVYVGAVLEHAGDAAITVQRALRIATAHGVWVAIASFAGSTGGGYDRAAGLSAIWNPEGEVVAQAGPDPGEWVSATLDNFKGPEGGT